MHWLALVVFCGNQTYTYNIRGWLKNLGSLLPNGYTQVNYYQESGATAPRYNGNISRIDWGGKEGSGGTFKTRTYNYLYDHANRLKSANFSAASEVNRFTVSGISYDANGNIYSMERNNQRTPSAYEQVDDLEYSYFRFSNRLSQVKDNNASLTYTAKDFKDRGTTEYGYDANGNMTSNEDKQISQITYNHLNLPQEITFTTGAKLKFAYDAVGNKLTQKVYDSNSTLTKTQDYLGEIVLLDGALDFLIHEEGRVASEPTGLIYEYYLKDHLGNIRQVLRNPAANARIATMETSKAEEEEKLFTQIKPTRRSEPKHNITPGGQEVAWLNASRGELVGPGTSQEIYEGDSVILSVHGKYLDEKKGKVNMGSFATSGAKVAMIDQLNELALNTSRAGGANPITVLNLVDILAKDLQRKEAPEAYLIYALYDEDSNRYEVGKQVLSRNAANQHEVLEEKLAIKKNGYIETFVVNETAQDVWFDNMRVMNVSSVIVQEIHYDPWGLELTGLGYQNGGIKVNKYLYNGKEYIEDNGLQYYDYGARMYDPAIGRWGVVDPLADNSEQVDKSPFAFTWNNPINLVDPDGLKPLTDFVDINSGSITRIDDGKDQVIAASSEAISQMQSLFDNDSEGYSTALGVLENSVGNLNLTRGEFDFFAETVYAESSGGFEESLGIINVLENRAANQGNSLLDQLSDKSPYGVYGIRKTGGSSYKYSYRNEKGAGANAKRANIHKAIAAGLTSATDVSNGAYFWDGRDFNGNSNINGGYRARYVPGYLFTSPSHDLWGQGSNKVGDTYKYQSTNAIGNTTFSKFYNQGTKWYTVK